MCHSRNKENFKIAQSASLGFVVTGNKLDA
jgi:hypothetical protein